MGRAVGLLEVCGVDGVMKVYSVSSAEYRGLTAVHMVCAVKWQEFCNGEQDEDNSVRSSVSFSAGYGW